MQSFLGAGPFIVVMAERRMNFNATRNCDYILFENCYAWGNGRYKFAGYQASHIVFRNCVGRLDRTAEDNMPTAVFTMYSVTYGEIQNCIAIDSDQDSAYTQVQEYAGSFQVTCTDMDANHV